MFQIGFMRNGKILHEDSPQHLMTKYNTDSLDECFLLISHEQENSCATTEYQLNNENSSNERTILKKGHNKQTSIFDILQFTTKLKMKALIMKNYWHISRKILP